MNFQTRLSIHLVCICATSFAVIALVSAPSRGRLQNLSNELVELRKTEVALSERMAPLEAESAIGDTLPAEMKWSGVDSAAIEIAMQQTLVDLAGANGLQALSFGAAQSPTAIKLSTNAYEIELEGGHEGISKFISDIEQHSPQLAISFLWVRQLPAVQGQTIAPVNARLTVWGFNDALSVTKQ